MTETTSDAMLACLRCNGAKKILCFSEQAWDYEEQECPVCRVSRSHLATDDAMLALADEVVREMYSVLPTQWDRDCLRSKVLNALNRAAARPAGGDREAREALRLLTKEDERQNKLHELLETIREQIRLEIEPEHRPDSLFTNIQNAVYAIRGRTPLMNDAAITSALITRPAGAGEVVAWIDFADNGNIRFWTPDADRASREKAAGRHLRGFTLAELVSLAAKTSPAPWGRDPATIAAAVKIARLYADNPVSLPGASPDFKQGGAENALSIETAIAALAAPKPQGDAAAKMTEER